MTDKKNELSGVGFYNLGTSLFPWIFFNPGTHEFYGDGFFFYIFFFFFNVDDMFGERKMTRFMFSSPLLEDVMGDNVNRTRYDMNELETIFLQTLSFSRRIKVLEHKQ